MEYTQNALGFLVPPTLTATRSKDEVSWYALPVPLLGISSTEIINTVFYCTAILLLVIGADSCGEPTNIYLPRVLIKCEVDRSINSTMDSIMAELGKVVNENLQRSPKVQGNT
jgi:hypothetical protein